MFTKSASTRLIYYKVGNRFNTMNKNRYRHFKCLVLNCWASEITCTAVPPSNSNMPWRRLLNLVALRKSPFVKRSPLNLLDGHFVSTENKWQRDSANSHKLPGVQQQTRWANRGNFPAARISSSPAPPSGWTKLPLACLWPHTHSPHHTSFALSRLEPLLTCFQIDRIHHFDLADAQNWAISFNSSILPTPQRAHIVKRLLSEVIKKPFLSQWKVWWRKHLRQSGWQEFTELPAAALTSYQLLTP